MKTIWKYDLTVSGHQSIEMPEDAEILAVQLQGDTLCLWAMVDTTAPKVEVIIRVVGTGHPISEGAGKYLATFQVPRMGLVFHVFEE